MNINKEKIIFLADISGDVDDLMAIQYLHNLGRLESVVLDGKSKDPEREKILNSQGIQIFSKIPAGTKILFCGGALTKVADYIKQGGPLELLVMNGFFAGSNVVEEKDILPKFKDKISCRSYNPGLDLFAADSVVNSDLRIILISKNVCHHPDNVRGKWHEDNFDCKPEKKLHDVLMVKEGLNFLDESEMLCEYERVDIQRVGQEWMAVKNPDSKIEISVRKK